MGSWARGRVQTALRSRWKGEMAEPPLYFCPGLEKLEPSHEDRALEQKVP